MPFTQCLSAAFVGCMKRSISNFFPHQLTHVKATSSRAFVGLCSRFGVLRRITFLFSSLFLFAGGSVHAQGILWDDTDVGVWRDRAVNGPYKSAGDAFDPQVPGEWSRIVSDKNTFMSNPTADREPVLEIPDNGTYRGSQRMVAAAFYALVQGDGAVANTVKAEILWHARASGTQVSPTQSMITDQGNWWKASWLLRFLMSADFIEDSFTTSELAEVKDWLSDWAHAYESSVHEELNNVWPNRYNRDYSNPGFAATSAGYNYYAYKDSSGVKHNPIPVSARYYNNRRSTIMQVVGLIGVWINDVTLMDRAKLYVEEWLQFSVFPDGSVGEFERNNISGNVQQGLIYNSANLEASISIASALSHVGDNSLFEFSTRNGIWGTESGAGEPEKNLKMAVYAYMDLIEHKRDWYFDRGSVIDDHRIDSTSETGGSIGFQWVGEIYFAPMGNRYWKDERIKQGYMRTAAGSVPYSSKFGSAGPLAGPWGGHQAAFPSTLFMFAQMEGTGVTNPELPPSPTSYPSGYREIISADRTIFGLDPAWAPGREFEKAFDGDSSTFYDYFTSAETFVGIDFHESKIATSIVFNARAGLGRRMVGGRFEGSNESSVSGFETIYEITSAPAASEQRIELNGGASYRFYRYIAPTGSYGNIAEFSVEFDTAAVGTSAIPLTWRTQYFGETNQAKTGDDEDFDGDGVSNYDEWVAGTDPTNANDLLGWFGAYSDQGNNWIYHIEHGWIFMVETSSDTIWLWAEDMGWLYTDATLYPNIYRTSDRAWLFYLRGSSNPRWFFNHSTRQWESH